ncbi:hypothetical protein HK405_003456 [Cladochytrium tenue]|nr:hypothetical protein HK405_003456 [Cladochytrium tenue]
MKRPAPAFTVVAALAITAAWAVISFAAGNARAGKLLPVAARSLPPPPPAAADHRDAAPAGRLGDHAKPFALSVESGRRVGGVGNSDGLAGGADHAPRPLLASTPSAHLEESDRDAFEDDEAPPSTLTPDQRHRLRPTRRAGRIAYLNRHVGTRANMNWIMRELGLNITHLDPDDLDFHYGMTALESARHRQSGAIAALCHQYDVIIVGDTIPDGRALLDAVLLDDPACAATHLVLEITNRFDFGIGKGEASLSEAAAAADAAAFRDALNALYVRDCRRLHVVANNPFEVYYAYVRGVRFRRWRLLRPSGHSYIPPLTDLKVKDAEDPVLAFKDLKPRLRQVFDEYSISVKSLDILYGGPHALVKYRAFVESPYQVSTMKLYENLAAGVVVAVPSSRLWRELNMFGVQEYTLCWPDVRHLAPAAYPRLVDFYHPDLASAIYHFDSFDDLRRMVDPGWSDAKEKNARAEGPLVMRHLRDVALRGWQDILFDAGALVY